MNKFLALLCSTALLSSCEMPKEPIPLRSDWGIGLKIMEPIEVCTYVKTKDNDMRNDCWEAYHSNGTTYGLYYLPGYGAVDDTLTAEEFSEHMDTIYLFRVINSDTMYYQSKNLMDLNSYYLQPVRVNESGTQRFSFLIDVSASDFY